MFTIFPGLAPKVWLFHCPIFVLTHVRGFECLGEMQHDAVIDAVLRRQRFEEDGLVIRNQRVVVGHQRPRLLLKIHNRGQTRFCGSPSACGEAIKKRSVQDADAINARFLPKTMHPHNLQPSQ